MSGTKGKGRLFRNALRPDSKGRPDDIAVSCDMVHIERMDRGAWWVGIYRGEKRSTFWFSSMRAINAKLTENELGLSDDTERPVTKLRTRRGKR